MVRSTLADRRTAWRGMLAGLGAGLVVVTLFAVHVFDGPYDGLQDSLFPKPPPGPDVTLVAIDQFSQERLVRHSWPYENRYHATVINELAKLHPRVIVFDAMLQRSASPAEDALLAGAIRAAGNVVLVCTADDPPDELFAGAALTVADRSLGLPVPLRPTPTCAANSSGEAAFLAALRAAGRGAVVPVQPNGEMLVNFTDGAGARTCAYAVAFSGGCGPKLVTDRIVVVGIKVLNADDVHSQAVAFVHDQFFCPRNQPGCMQPNQNYGYRILADEISTAINGRGLHLEPAGLLIFAVLSIGMGGGLLLYLLPFRAALLATMVGLAAYVLAALLLARLGLLVDPLYAPAALVLTAGAALSARYLLEERERRKVEALFGQYVDPRMIANLVRLRGSEALQLRGRRKELTLLFVDIRGFTSMSEAMAAEAVVTLTTEYLTALTEVILKWDGTIDKYVGDEIVAVWNAPYDQPEHALLAVRCAYDLVGAAGVLQEGLLARGLPPVRYGIGINTGPVVWGNMGSPIRQQFTALGDTVNTAARLCSAAGPFELLLGGQTFERCRDYLAVELRSGLELKGKTTERLRVFRAVAIRDQPASPWVPFPTEPALTLTYANVARFRELQSMAPTLVLEAADPPPGADLS